MANENADKQKSFTFTWTLENASYCFQKKEQELKSPSFFIHWLEMTKWHLSLYPRGLEDESYVGLCLSKERDSLLKYSSSANKGEIHFEISLLAADSSVLKSSKAKHRFDCLPSFEFSDFETRKKIFVEEKSNFLPKGNLTVRCRMWSTEMNIDENEECFGRTRIGVEWRYFVWKIPNFSQLQPEKKQTFMITSAANDKQLVSVSVFLTEKLSYEELIRCEFANRNSSAKFTVIRLVLLDADGNVTERVQDEFWFDDRCKQFQLSLPKRILMANRSLYLPGDVLTLRCESAIATGIDMEKIEKFYLGRCGDRQSISSDVFCSEDKEHSSLSTPVLQENFKFLYSEGFLSDVVLKTKTAKFPVHKSILAARSSVFNAMFLGDMKEKDSDCVDIEDISDDTLNRMLLYLYTAVVKDLQWESALDLYKAADKYQIPTLKDNCSSFLQCNLTPSNACEILLLSDLHQDGDLKTCVQNFILKRDRDIFNSGDWSHVMENNSVLAAQTMHLKFK
ncbi:speckle-type POZ protein-like B [Caerostris extrusa]|uniref:Speckle-type POZ protein-like B n=1 Tax=Caerostris extrusa TaxID=172846 RepID=A0AAV4VGL1_CAEEX|nr:speckle-type POZ protein-like B [Caerostris extrusa]